MKRFPAVIAVAALLVDPLLAAPPVNADPKAPDVKEEMRMKFQAYDGNPKKPETMTFQINALDLRQPSSFLKLGDKIDRTNYKLAKFAFQQQRNPNTGKLEDASELTIVDTVTNREFVLVLDKITKVPKWVLRI